MKTILVVDDEFAIVEVVSELLTNEGYHTITAHNGQEALARLAQAPTDLVLSDVMMPILDGLAFAEAIRANPAYRQTPVVLMSAATDAVRRAPRVWNTLLPKPLDVDRLLATIAELIGPP